jgi:hypothetical protein
MAEDGAAADMAEPTHIPPDIVRQLAESAGDIISAVSSDGSTAAEFNVLISRGAAREIKERWKVRVEREE